MSVTEMIKWLDGRTRSDFFGFVHLNEAAAMLREAREIIEYVQRDCGVTHMNKLAERWLKE